MQRRDGTGPVGDRSIHELTKPLYQAVGLSMMHTGLKTSDGKDAYTHEDYDDAMACLGELVRRAKEAEGGEAPDFRVVGDDFGS